MLENSAPRHFEWRDGEVKGISSTTNWRTELPFNVWMRKKEKKRKQDKKINKKVP